MSTTLTGLINESLNILQKNTGTQGFYTTAKMELFCNEAIDYLSARMMESASGEWVETSQYVSTVAGDSILAISADIVCIKKVSYLIANVYQPLVYNELRHEVTYAGSIFTFTITTPTVAPSIYDVYSNNGSTFSIAVSNTGQIVANKISGSNNPTATGNLVRVSGVGDATIAYSAVVVEGSGVQQYPSTYYIQGSNIIFDPPIAIGGTNAIKIDCTKFPLELTGSATLPGILNRAFQHFIAYRTAWTAASSIGKAQKEWADTYQEWFDVMLRLVDKRVDQPRAVKEFNE
jgi:hypothetical protein